MTTRNNSCTKNVKILNKYIELLNEHRYADIDLYTYFGRDKVLFGETLNEIIGDKYFYYNLVNNMDYANGYSYRGTDMRKTSDVEKFRKMLKKQLEKFKIKVSQIY